MLLHDLVATSSAVSATRSRLEKRRLLAGALRAAGPDEVDVVATFLSGGIRQRRTGVGWRTLSDLPAPATDPTLTPAVVDEALDRIAGLSGAGSQEQRAREVGALFGAATAAEQEWLRGVISGELRQGALDALLLEAIAEAADIPVGVVRRAAMFSAPTGPVAAAALLGGREALAAFGLEVGRPVRPMLASSAPDVDAALAGFGGEVAVDCKIDGIRIQVHRSGGEVTVFTRSLDDITARLPEVVEAALALDVTAVILDGEAVALGADGRPRPFQETGSRAMSRDAGLSDKVPLTALFFDVLHLDGTDLIDAPASERFEALGRVVPEAERAPRIVTDDPVVASGFSARMIGLGHEGVVVKDLDAPYDAGRRGSGWVKVKPRHTLDLVVLAVEWGSGRRQGLLSNIHLGARDGAGFTMLGKTFKGMTDAVLAWQTARFLELETRREGHVVHVRPEQVVEIAFDGVQRSRRYPGGVALRFARVLRYRDDKTAAEADTLEAVRALA
ncbi:ATP-dependent DNA ligase [Tessaracoccus sp. G1721]